MNKLRPEMKDHPLSQAAREINDGPDRHDLAKTCANHGLKLDDVVYMAEQRALRALYARYGINLQLQKPAVLSLSKADEALMPTLIAAYMDGLLIGWRGKEIYGKANHN